VEHNSKLKTIILLFLIFSLTVYPVFATTIFSDGFESGDFTAWTGTYLQDGQTLEVIAAAKHHGTYGLHVAFVADWKVHEECYKQITGVTTIYARVYTKFNTLPASNNAVFYVLTLAGDYWQYEIAEIGVLRSGSAEKWQCRYLSAGTTMTTTNIASPAPTTGQWYCLEVEAVISNTVGEVHVWIDGTERFTLTGLDNDGFGNIDFVRVGLEKADNIQTTYPDIYVDCVVVADAYIGPEVSGQDLTFQLSQTIHLTSSLTEGKEKRFSLSQIIALTSSLTQQKELGFPLSETVKATSSLTMNKEIAIVIHEWLYSLQETAQLTANLYTNLEIAEKVSLGLGFYIGILALVIALMAYLRSRH